LFMRFAVGAASRAERLERLDHELDSDGVAVLLFSPRFRGAGTAWPTLRCRCWRRGRLVILIRKT
jgi:hypothetical protein